METNQAPQSEVQQLIKLQEAIYNKLSSISGWITFFGVLSVIAILVAIFNLLIS